MDSNIANFKVPIQAYTQTLLVYQLNHYIPVGFCLTYASLEQLQQAKKTFLHKEELGYLSTLPFAKRQQSYLLGRFAAKEAIRHCSPEPQLSVDILIKPGFFEQPVVYSPNYTNIQISLSHSGFFGYAMAFPEAYPMGVDLEPIQTHIQSIVQEQLTKTEKEWIHKHHFSDASTLYTIHWTLKEALSKILRTGMTSPFEIFAVTNLSNHNGFWTSEFENFTQYQGFSFLLDNIVCSIVYPKRIHLSINTQAILAWFQYVNQFFKITETI
jgi:phosphopantetheinyl transferase (holo-ACP synthase)